MFAHVNTLRAMLLIGLFLPMPLGLLVYHVKATKLLEDICLKLACHKHQMISRINCKN